jgi:hypothetical protein
VRDLTPAEHRTVLSILALPQATERQRMRFSQLPSSTFNVVRRRVSQEGWLADVLVPNPGPCGLDGVDFALGRPSVSQREKLLLDWGSDPDCVLLWSGVHAVFGVFFRRRPTGSNGGGTGDPDVDWIRARQGTGSIPVYFDYSGLWARFGGQQRPVGYPFGLDASSPAANPRALADALRMLGSDGPGHAAQGQWTTLARLRHGRSRAIEDGVVQSRTVLHHAQVPPFEGRRIGEVVFIHGRLRPRATASDLLNVLTNECEVYPFLLAESTGRVILAGLGQTSSREPGRVLIPSAARPVMSVVDRHIDPAEVLIEPVEAIQERIQHQYPHRFPGEDRP